MSTQIPFPNKRLVEAGIGNPLFITDIENLTDNLLEAMAIIYGFASNGFAILSGFNGGGAGGYTGGIVYMNGNFYRCIDGVAEGQYLTPNPYSTLNKIFSDANTYPTYYVYDAIASDVQWGGMPIFYGDMNQFRVSIKKINDYVNTFGNIVTHNVSEFDASGAASTAQSNAISTASADATSKANAAQSNAISTASADATSKANAAYSNAVAKTKSGMAANVGGGELTTVVHNLNIPVANQSIQLTYNLGSSITGWDAFVDLDPDKPVAACNVTTNSFDIYVPLANADRDVYWLIHDNRV